MLLYGYLISYRQEPGAVVGSGKGLRSNVMHGTRNIEKYLARIAPFGFLCEATMSIFLPDTIHIKLIFCE